jgi:protein-tyrosine phosphatase
VLFIFLYIFKCDLHPVVFYLLHTLIVAWLQAVDFDPDSLRSQLPKSVSALEWAISQCKGRVYVHCTAGLGRAPAVATAYMFWFKNMDVSLFHLNMCR